jgi:hypothetical protein
LLGLEPLEEGSEEGVQEPIMMAIQTPETYLGYMRGRSYVQSIVVKGSEHEYTMGEPDADQVALKGLWTVSDENITSGSDSSELALNFKANRVYLVLGGNSNESVKVYIDGKEAGEFQVTGPKKYDVVNLRGEGGRHELRLVVPKGIQAYAFTFGMEE